MGQHMRDSAAPIHIVLASDGNLIRQAGITALSATLTASGPIHATFLTPPASAQHPDWELVRSALRTHGVQSMVVPVQLDSSKLQLASHLTAVTYYRILLPRVLPESLTRVIYLDCDVIVNRDLRELWETDMRGHCLAAVDDAAFSDWERIGLSKEQRYFNAGVLLLDVAALRANALFDTALEFSRLHAAELTWADQCALNKTFAGRWLSLPRHWNYQHAMLLHDIRAVGMRQARRLASGFVIHFNHYERPWQIDSPHPLKRYYVSIVRAHPQLDLSIPRTLHNYWVLLKRLAKWRLVSVPGSRHFSSALR
jgi:lipopolysaccharide biosynthesis glycosyltransferase